MNYLENQSLLLDQLRTGVKNLSDAQAQASSLKFAREGLVTNFLSSVFSRASVALTDFVEAVYPKPDTALITGFSNSQSLDLKDTDYVKLRVAQLSTMEGFIGKYLPYGKQVRTSLNYYEQTLQPQIKEFRLLLGGIINNQEDRKALMSLEPQYKKQRAALDDLDKEGSTYWARGSFKSIQTVGDVIDRSSDLPEIYTDAKAIAETLKAISFQEVQSQVSQVRDLVRIAIKAIDSGNLTQVSDAQLKNLSFGILALAESVEFFGLTLYRANVYLSAVSRLKEVVKKMT